MTRAAPRRGRERPAIGATVGRLISLPVADLTEDEQLELLEAAERLRTRSDALCVRAAGAIDRSKAWTVSGARSAKAWMTWRCGVTSARATEHLGRARDLRGLPGTEAALMAGRITTDHVRLLAQCRRTAPEELLADEATILGRLDGQAFQRWESVLSYWRKWNAPEDADRDAVDAFERRELHVATSFEETVVLDAILDPIGGGIVQKELERLEQRLFEADWAEARERLGCDPALTDLRRTKRQRMADAQVEMARRSAAKREDGREPRVLLHVLAGDESVRRLCELTNGTVVSPGALLPYLDWLDVERVLFEGPSKVIDVGPRRRLFRGATRWAVHLRDRGCTDPTCDAPIDRCEVDHVVPFTAGGQTVQANGEDKCGFHNRRKGSRRPPGPDAA